MRKDLVMLLRSRGTRAFRDLPSACVLGGALSVATLQCWAQRLPAAAPAPAPVKQLIPRAAEGTPTSIESGDLLSVQVFDTPELSASHRVEPDGTIALPGSGTIHVAGLTPSAAGDAVAERLRSAQIMLHPQVSVTITEFTSAGISILGEVKLPGTYTLLGPQTLYTVLAAAGGVTPNQGSTITITHHSEPKTPVTLRIPDRAYNQQEATTVVYPGDTVYVSESGVIYVVGDVTRPGQYHLTNGQPLRALNAVALAEGMRTTAAMSHASIIRTTADGAETIHLDLGKIAKNEASDPVLEPADILVIPRSGAKEFFQLALPGVTGAAANAASLALIYR